MSCKNEQRLGKRQLKESGSRWSVLFFPFFFLVTLLFSLVQRWITSWIMVWEAGGCSRERVELHAILTIWGRRPLLVILMYRGRR
jgi:hypothetical protein